MPHCPICTRGVAHEEVVIKGRTSYVCASCAEKLKFQNMGEKERLAYLKKLEEEIEYRESGKKA